MTTGTTSARLSIPLLGLCYTALACAPRPQTAAAPSTAVTADGFDVRIGTRHAMSELVSAKRGVGAAEPNGHRPLPSLVPPPESATR